MKDTAEYKKEVDCQAAPKLPRTRQQLEFMLAEARQDAQRTAYHAARRDINQELENAKNRQKIDLMHAVSELAQANAKLTYSVALILGERR